MNRGKIEYSPPKVVYVDLECLVKTEYIPHFFGLFKTPVKVLTYEAFNFIKRNDHVRLEIYSRYTRDYMERVVNKELHHMITDDKIDAILHGANASNVVAIVAPKQLSHKKALRFRDVKFSRIQLQNK